MINYFISSTFSDMQVERDAIINRIIPYLKREFHIRGEDVLATDLRWGVCTDGDEEAAKKTIISVCINTIEECIPYFIILLGDRYGSVPDSKSVQALSEGRYAAFSKKVNLNECSITEMEIKYALEVFDMCKKTRVIVCFRDPLPQEQLDEESRCKYFCKTDNEKHKLEILKSELKKKFPDDCISYSVKWNKEKREIENIEEFIEKLTDKIKQQIDEDLPSIPKTDIEIQNNLEKVLDSKNTKFYSDRLSEEEQIESFLKSDDKTLLLYGKSGTGKSSILSTVCTRHSMEMSVIKVTCGKGLATNAWGMVRYIYSLLENSNSVENDDSHYAEFVHEIDALLERKDKAEKILIVFDGLEKLTEDYHLDNFDFLPQNKKCKIIISCTNDFAIEKMGQIITFSQSVKLSEIDYDETSKCLDRHLERIGKDIPADVRDKILNISAFKSPFFISLLCDRINMMARQDFKAVELLRSNGNRTEDNLYGYIAQIADRVSTESDLVKEIVNAGEAVMPVNTIWKIIWLVNCFEEDLPIEKLVGILANENEQISCTDIRILIYYLEGIFSLSENRILFSRDSIKRICSKFEYYKIDERNLVVNAFSYITHKLSDTDSMKIAHFMKFAYMTNNSIEARKYLIKVACEKDEISEQVICENYSYMIMQSIARLYRSEDKYRLTEFICDVFMPEKEEDVYYLLSDLEILTSSFNIIIMEAEYTRIIDVMEILCERLLGMLKGKFDYMRLAYRCFEKISLYINNINEKRMYLQRCYAICREAEIQFENEAYHPLIIDDLSHISCHVAKSFQNTEWKQAVDLLDYAIRRINCNYKVIVEKDYPIPIEVGLYEAYLIKFDLAYNKIFQYRKNEWFHKITPDLEMILESSAVQIIKGIDTIDTKRGLKQFYGKDCLLCNLYLAVASYFDYTGQAYYDELLHAKTYAENILSKSKTFADFERIGIIEARLTSDDVQSVEERTSHYSKAYEYAAIMNEMSCNHPSKQKLLAIILKQLADYQYENARKTYDEGNLSEAAKIASDFLPKIFPHSEVLDPCFYFNWDNPNPSKRIIYYDADYGCLQKWADFGMNVALKTYETSSYNANDMSNALLIIKALRPVLSDDYGYQIYSIGTKSQFFNCKVYDTKHMIEHYYAVCSWTVQYDMGRKKYYNELELHNGEKGFMRSMLVAWIYIAYEMLCTSNKDEERWRFVEYSISKHNRIPGKENACLSLLKLDKELYEEKLLLIGRWLCENFENEKVKRTLIKNNILELAAMQYAYSKLQYSLAEDIILNGYRNYLELPAMYLIRKYDRKRFEFYLEDVSSECREKLTRSACKYKKLIGVHVYNEIDKSKIGNR